MRNVTWKMTVINENSIIDYVTFRADIIGADKCVSLAVGTRQGFQVKK